MEISTSNGEAEDSEIKDKESKIEKIKGDIAKHKREIAENNQLIQQIKDEIKSEKGDKEKKKKKKRLDLKLQYEGLLHEEYESAMISLKELERKLEELKAVKPPPSKLLKTRDIHSPVSLRISASQVTATQIQGRTSDTSPPWENFWRDLDNASITEVNIVNIHVTKNEGHTHIDDVSTVDVRSVDNSADTDDFPIKTSSQLLRLKAPHPDNITQVYVRQAYIDLYERYIKTTIHTLVLGNPGTGKSLFAIYVLYRLRNESGDVDVIYHHTLSRILLHFCSNGSVQVIDSVRCLTLVSEIKGKGKEVYYLCDCGTNKSELNTTVAGQCTRSIVFTSPCVQNYADYQKHCMVSNGTRVCMPIWSLGELCTCSQATGSSVDRALVCQRYQLFGGIARYVLAQTSNMFYVRDIESYIAGLKDVDTILNMLRENNVGDHLSHKCVHMNPRLPDYTNVQYMFASSHVAEKIFHHFERQKNNSVFHMMQKMAREPVFHGAFGQVFEPFAHYKVCKGGSFKVRSLESGESSDLHIGKMETVLFTEFPEFLDGKYKYYLPLSKTHPTIDSFESAGLSTARVFQMTVAHRHSIKMPALTTMMKKYSLGSINFYFVVPKKNFAEFRKQRYLKKDGGTWTRQAEIAKIKQFVLSVDLGNGSE